MRENLHFVDRLHRDLGTVRWAEPAQIRAVARRRSRRTALLAATAVLAVVSGAGYAAAGRPVTPVPPIAATPASTVVPAEIPPEVLLAPSDVPLRTGVRLGESGLGETVRVDPLLESCGRHRGVPSTGPKSRSSRSRTMMRPAVGSPTTPVLTQDVYRLEPRHGRLLFGTVSLLLNACAEWQFTDSVPLAGGTTPTVRIHRWEAPVSGFAGDESVMLRHTSLPPHARAAGTAVDTAPRSEVTMVVRVGDLVTVIATGPDVVEDTGEGTRSAPRLSRTQLETLGRTAARRLCVAADPGC
ncbi:hypothetical protein [Micromonospora halophytica]|uniref:Uncharacterized protein n=1 Tax=Micromonospora halophytica TaxID=47864 RepID=A0A1C5H733_9ACTN|nr:hypothetical protein [Micromonospora halophytica]SCG41842.1 hypothetical protein GA0070560_103208 [Micromonospora halophytica]